MKNRYPYITNDGSVGLYSVEFDDIYHSTFGAYTEACEKFVIPADLFYYTNKYKSINILDICYGIGYNTKSVLNFLYSDTIGSDNISVYINAIDTDEELIFLSPFFTCRAQGIPKVQNLPTEKVKHLHSEKIEIVFDFDNFINVILVKNIKNKFPNFLKNKKLINFLKNSDNSLYIDNKYIDQIDNDNIYYVENPQNARQQRMFENVKIDYNIEDARRVIEEDKNKYHLIFLDAFTPTKCPCLWTLEFFKLLFEHLEDDGRILTYSNSAQVRNAFLSAGFYVGKIYNERTKTFTGTIAVKNKDFIKFDLSEYDLRLIKTRAGIFYRDKNLRGLNEAIIDVHKLEVENSALMSSSKFIKEWRKNHNEKI